MRELVSNPDQDRRMRAVLIAMECLSYGATYAYNGPGGREKPSGGNCPSGDSEPLHLEWRAKYVLAAPADREDVIAQATDALIAMRCGPRVDVEDEPREKWEERLIKDGEGAEPRWLATMFLTGVREVMKVRIAYKRDPNTGRPQQGLTPAQLAAEGLTARQIMAVLPETKAGTAQYYVNRSRKAA